MIDRITNAISKTLPDLVKSSQSIELRQFTGSSSGFFLNKLREVHSHILVITPDIEKSSEIASDLQELSGESDSFTPLIFPPSKQKAYDNQMVEELSVLVQRSEVLEQLKSSDFAVVLTSADAICEKMISSADFQKRSISLETGDLIEPGQLREKLANQGYQSVKFVDEPGEYAVRGGIFDVFPFSGNYPVRLEFFGDEIESIREFDPDSQRSIAFLNQVRFVPNATFDTETPKQSLFKYLPEDYALYLYDPDLVLDKIESTYKNAIKIYTGQNGKNRVKHPDEDYINPELYIQELQNRFLAIDGSFHESIKSFDTSIDLHASPHPEFNGSIELLKDYIRGNSEAGIRTVILCDSQNQRERFEELLGEPDETNDYQFLQLTLHEGFVLKNEKIALLTDHQIFNRYHRPQVRRKKNLKGGISFKELKDLNVCDYVVHVDYGIGQFAGFKKIEVKGTLQEAAVLKYKEGSVLYVNVSSLHKLQKYSGKEGTAPRITKLGSGEWERKKSKTRKKVKDIARDLIQLYANRKTQKAHAFDGDMAWQTEMEARFEYEETPDQMTAIEKVKKDMETANPMDRLVCGDVGFGKTEVAIRAAFKAVMDQKQVAILVPTTILADQHYKTFTGRMKDFPVNIEVLSRFRSVGEQKDVLKDLEKGKVDIVIGTHRLVSKDVRFKDLGLLVIDEEQRFGVTVKEKLKKFRATMDVLTMTATPIPRTLQFSLMGARDLSIINTPPRNRQPVYTEIHSFNNELIRDAILQEISRGGQVFFIHNRVKNIEQIAELIHQLVPDIRVNIGHGQMKPAKLEKVIHDFYNHKFDLLISTNIVENGIDIANANTILINNANHFGLSELHQLRGRVGRSNRKAFCYLLTPQVKSLTTEARKRLRALEEFSDLGSGFNIAMRDLDIRGAGDILGAEQSGFINDLGFELYTKILDDAVREIKDEEFSGLFDAEERQVEYPETLVEFDYSALLDSDYVSDSVERLNLYRKLSESESDEEIDAWKEELEDRFGALPDTAKNLMTGARIKLHASRLFIKKITIRSGRMWILCPDNESVYGKNLFESGLFQQILNLIQQMSAEKYEVVQKKKSLRLVIHDLEGPDEALGYLKQLRKNISQSAEVAV